MTPQATVELLGLNQLIHELQDTLIGYGDMSADLPRTFEHQAGLLANEISAQLGPKTKARGEAAIAKDIAINFAEITVPVFPAEQRGYGPIEWMFGVKKHNYLVGVDPKDVQLDLSVDEMNRGTSKKRGVKWLELARSIRGKRQRFVQLNRVIVARGRMAALKKLKSKRVGRMRAIFAYAAEMCGIKGIPDWIADHFKDVSAEGRAVFDNSKLFDRVNPQIVFGGGAPGLHQFADKIEDAVATRSMKVADRIARIIKAYAQQHARGERLTHQFKTE